MKKIISVIIVLAVLAGVALALRFLTPEDSWICENNVWVKHGNPASAAPTAGCGEPIVCPRDFRECPDGSSVSRVAPTCEFPACPTSDQLKTVVFNCSDNKFIEATFNLTKDETVKLKLSDGRSLQVPHAISASGARYATPDESFVFWNKGDSAFIEEAVGMTYENCALSTCKAGVFICPSGDEVRRAGKDCQFATCPEDKSSPVLRVPNPASVNCRQAGGNLVTKERPDGGQYSLCYFDDNRACEEWSMLRGECPVGGVKTTGYDTEAQSFCAWSGGQTSAVENTLCTFSDGSTCPADDFYAGTCAKGDNK